MNSKILKDAQGIITSDRASREGEAKKILSAALINKEFKVAYSNWQESIINLAKKPTQSAEKKLSKAKLLLEKVAQAHKININNIFITPKCKVCNDTGVIEGKYCQCTLQQANKLLLQQSNINKTLASFKDFDTTLFDNNQGTLIKEKMQKWCSKPNSICSVLICGNTGSGKTFLAECMANELIKLGKYIYFTTAFNFNNQMLKYHTTFDASKSSILEPFLNCDVLFIDDLGTEPIIKNVTKEYLYVIVNERLINNKQIVISTNLDLNELYDRYDGRSISRLMNKSQSVAINLIGKDLRLKKY